MKIEIYCHLIADILIKNVQNVSWVVLNQACHFSPTLSIWLVAIRLNLRKNIKQINSSEAICGLKLKLCSVVHYISLYKGIVFYCSCFNTLVSIATLNFHRLMGRMKIGIIAISLQILWPKFFRNVCWVVLYQYTFCPTLSIWLVVMATKRLNLRFCFKKSTPQTVRSYMGDKFETLQKCSYISLYYTIVFYCCCIHVCTFVAMAT